MAGATEYTRYVNAADYAVPIRTARVTNGAARVARQTDPASVDVGSEGLYPIAGSSEQDFGIADVMFSAQPGQYTTSLDRPKVFHHLWLWV